MANTMEMIREFPRFLERHCLRASERDVKKIASDIEKVRSLNPQIYNEKEIAEFLKRRSAQLKHLVGNYFMGSLARVFPIIDEKLFEQKRYLTIKKRDKEYKVIGDVTDEEANQRGEKNGRDIKVLGVPLVVYTPLFSGERKVKLGSFSKASYNYGYYSRRFSLEAKLPGGVGPNLKEAYREAMEQYFLTLANMFTNPVASDIIYSEGELIKPVVGAVWIPQIEAMNIKATERLARKTNIGEPAMVLAIKGRKYFVKTWKIDDEASVEDCLKGLTQ